MTISIHLLNDLKFYTHQVQSVLLTRLQMHLQLLLQSLVINSSIQSVKNDPGMLIHHYYSRILYKGGRQISQKGGDAHGG